MACVAPPPPQVAAVIQVGAAAAGYPLTFRATDPASANYLIDDRGDWDFSCFKQPIKVALSIGTTGVVFYYGGGKDALSFADDPAGAKQPVTSGNHQVPGGPKHMTAQSLWFTYHNDWDGGRGDGVQRYPRSAYGLFFGDPKGNFLTATDPVVNNGGNNN